MKIIILGDSIAAGLGVQGKSYADLLGDMGHSVFNFSKSAMQINESLEVLKTKTIDNIDLVIIAHGITEAIIRPKQAYLKYLPSRWRRAGWMDPRPYYSKRWHKKWIQKVESAIRWRIKNFLIVLYGGRSYQTRNDFYDHYKQLINLIMEGSQANILVLSHCGIDEHFYPGSAESLNSFYDETKVLSNSRIYNLDLTQVCNKWEDFLEDHFHPNSSGHKKIFKEIADSLPKCETVNFKAN
ncbi:SGNH/GDSL hydrolase family protein [Paenibacillus daejeonensis]|uniref:SGNH/GDSL hydrolase family protein n=1 Tax=Paenibacillus daejeonensis TaxID=135193 RepID=UPI0003719CE1|nr:SGNH/GDSL hydrolase family protein [Paenibacillus daejeonensis]